MRRSPRESYIEGVDCEAKAIPAHDIAISLQNGNRLLVPKVGGEEASCVRHRVHVDSSEPRPPFSKPGCRHDQATEGQVFHGKSVEPPRGAVRWRSKDAAVHRLHVALPSVLKAITSEQGDGASIRCILPIVTTEVGDRQISL
eukprot:scaffold1345_cov223-Pinguiococcus_pyrenoidosus.AAC.3